MDAHLHELAVGLIVAGGVMLALLTIYRRTLSFLARIAGTALITLFATGAFLAIRRLSVVGGNDEALHFTYRLCMGMLLLTAVCVLIPARQKR